MIDDVRDWMHIIQRQLGEMRCISRNSRYSVEVDDDDREPTVAQIELITMFHNSLAENDIFGFYYLTRDHSITLKNTPRRER